LIVFRSRNRQPPLDCVTGATFERCIHLSIGPNPCPQSQRMSFLHIRLIYETNWRIGGLLRRLLLR
jgi:hypothetical protein